MSWLAAAGAIGGGAANVGLSSARGKTNWSRTKRMMQKRHQWEVKDLRAAGLNPILSAGSAPSMGSPPNTVDKDMSKPMDQILSQRLGEKTIENIEARTKLTTAQERILGPAALGGSAITGGIAAIKAELEKFMNSEQAQNIVEILKTGGPANPKPTPQQTAPAEQPNPQVHDTGWKNPPKLKRRKGETGYQFWVRERAQRKLWRSNAMNRNSWRPN